MNKLGQRTSVEQSGTAFGTSQPQWQWGYDSLGQVTSANQYLTNPNESDVAADRAYEYDAIGNRKKVATGTLTLPGTDNYVTIAHHLNYHPASPMCYPCPEPNVLPMS